MSGRITCGDFSDRLGDFVSGRLGADEAAAMEAHRGSCEDCAGIYDMKTALTDGPAEVPVDVEQALVRAVISDVAAAKESGRSRRSWAQRYLMPAMAAAIVIFFFMTGYMLGEIRHLHGENSELRGELAVWETALVRSGGISTGSVPAFRSLPGGRMSVGDAVRILESMPGGTPLLTEQEAERIIAADRRLGRYAVYLEDRPWEGGLTSTELLLLIETLEIDHDKIIPAGWRDRRNEI
jgi:hypothetical protein